MSKKKEKKLKLQLKFALERISLLTSDQQLYEDLLIETLKLNPAIDCDIYVNFEEKAVFCNLNHMILMATFNALFFSDGRLHWTILGNTEFIRDYKEKYFNKSVLIPYSPLK